MKGKGRFIGAVVLGIGYYCAIGGVVAAETATAKPETPKAKTAQPVEKDTSSSPRPSDDVPPGALPDASPEPDRTGDAEEGSEARAGDAPASDAVVAQENDAAAEGAAAEKTDGTVSSMEAPAGAPSEAADAGAAGGDAVSTTTKVVAPVPVVSISPAERDLRAGDAAQKEDDAIVTGEWTKSLLFSTKSGSFRFQPRGWIQPRFGISVDTDDALEDEDRLDGTGFGIQRARFGFQAWLYNWGHVYLDTGWKSGTPQLIDYFVDVGPKNGAGPVGVRVGFFRPYFIRQLLQATTKLAMVDYARAWTDGDLNLGLGISGRQLGLGLQGFVLGGLEYGVGIWNGSDGYDVDADFMYGGRVAVHPLGFSGVGDALTPGDESDASRASRPALSIGAALYLENRSDVAVPEVVFDPVTLDPVPFDDLQLKTGVDLAFKYAGLSLAGEFFFVKRYATESVIQDQLEASHRAAPGVGAYFQIGYAVLKERLELVGRFDMVDENTDIRGIRFYPTVGATVFVYGNNLKVQAQYRINAGTGYERDDPGYLSLSHDVLFMLQASI